jgi:hypothetical protein
MLDLKAVEERPEGLVPGPPQAMSVPHLPFAIQTIAVFGTLYFFFFFISPEWNELYNYRRLR